MLYHIVARFQFQFMNQPPKCQEMGFSFLSAWYLAKLFRNYCIQKNKMSRSWNPYIDYDVSKTNRMLGLIKRTCKGLDDPMTLWTLYCSLVCSNLEYSSVVWSPNTKRNIDKLERVQRRATKFILKSNDPYDIRLKKLNLMSLEKSRLLTK